MRFIIFICCLILVAAAGCLDDQSGVGEVVSRPNTPAGPDTVQVGQPGEFFTGGAVSSKEHALEYQFDFDAGGDHSYSGWQALPTAEKSWPDTGTYQVKAQARCAKHPGNTSPWSAKKPVVVVMGALPVPDTPSGPADAWTGQVTEYCTGEVFISYLHPVEYRFDFDADGSHFYSPWQDTSCLEVIWDNPGDFVVKAQIRMVNDTTEVSPWSGGLAVTVREYTLPEIRFATHITRVIGGTPTTITRPYTPHVLDTVGVCRPLSISYHGVTDYFPVTKYQFFPMTMSVVIDGQSVWTADLSDTIQFIDLCGNSYYNGVFRFAAQCEDAAGGQSIVDAGRFEQGVCEVVVNFDPDTRITQLLNTYFVNQTPVARAIDFEDAVPDTMPMNSWITLFYTGWDSPHDSSMCQDPANQCIKYQKAYYRYSGRFSGSEAYSSFLPHDPEDNNPFGVADSTSMNMGSVEYEVYIRSLDEHGRPDGTPAQVDLVGNFDPVLDECYLSDHLNNPALDGDTITWDWWHPANSDTFNEATLQFEKTFHLVINAGGHDHHMEPASGVKNWLYFFYDQQGVYIRFARAGGWVAGDQWNVLSDTMKVTFAYPLTDPAGDEVFNNLPNYLNKTYDLVLKGRDTEAGDTFDQYMFVNGTKTLVNSYPVSLFGRWTEERTVRFHFRMIR